MGPLHDKHILLVNPTATESRKIDPKSLVPGATADANGPRLLKALGRKCETRRWASRGPANDPSLTDTHHRWQARIIVSVLHLRRPVGALASQPHPYRTRFGANLRRASQQEAHGLAAPNYPFRHSDKTSQVRWLRYRQDRPGGTPLFGLTRRRMNTTPTATAAIVMPASNAYPSAAGRPKNVEGDDGGNETGTTWKRMLDVVWVREPLVPVTATV